MMIQIIVMMMMILLIMIIMIVEKPRRCKNVRAYTDI